MIGKFSRTMRRVYVGERARIDPDFEVLRRFRRVRARRMTSSPFLSAPRVRTLNHPAASLRIRPPHVR